MEASSRGATVWTLKQASINQKGYANLVRLCLKETEIEIKPNQWVAFGPDFNKRKDYPRAGSESWPRKKIKRVIAYGCHC